MLGQTEGQAGAMVLVYRDVCVRGERYRNIGRERQRYRPNDRVGHTDRDREKGRVRETDKQT